MKSTAEQLRNRGFASDELTKNFSDKSFNELLESLKSVIPTERTLSARLLALKNNDRAIKYLCLALHRENKLYSKIEISNSLVAYGVLAVPYLIDSLGKIGKNQHKIIKKEEFKKSSYPLPRDIAARTLIRIGKSALPALLNILNTGLEEQVSEAIDAIGYICFYDKHDNCLAALIHCYNNSNNDLIKWKIVRSLSGFSESLNFLEQESIKTENQDIRNEIGRIVELIIKNNDRLG